MPHIPTAEQVAVEWAKTVDGIDASKVATKLPADVSVWAATGFVTATVVGGGDGTDTPVYGPVVRFDCWAANVDSSKAPWGRAGSLAEALRFATYSHHHQDVDLGVQFDPARILSVHPVGPPLRVPLDEAGFARVSVDVQLHWTVTR